MSYQFEHDASAMAGGRLRIDLAALVENYRAIRSRVAPARLAAVVKADAYGLGAGRVAGALHEVGCRDYFVAHLAEALALRPLIPAGATVYVLNGLMPGSEAACARTDIVPVLNSLDQARRWQAAARAIGRPLPAVLQVDSGMSRLGLAPEDAVRLAGTSAFKAHISLLMVMSHLACADEADHPANAAQLASFTALAKHFPGTPMSLANSGGAFLPAGFHGDVVRAGVALYGGAPHDGPANPMRPVIALDARVIQLRTVPAGSGVGYGHSFRVKRPTRIATIGVGYADGLPRSLGNSGAAWFKGHRLPIAGRVSMDSITLDASSLAEGALAPGDWVELIGASQSLDTLARDAGTISYEILTSLGGRYHRHYREPARHARTNAA
ncbi:alanine racemase [Sphingomonas laterariae]|uniref:Alanine racemase n=1 Tax=Edaphosphingomonas laterariae TaxID=861865 RepID=A0A239FFK2_9SPHN|nr:alanine racemase [Sphingomonas laterariae]SNS55577.1 alanine racemase [Sphingomonas laterariae]